MYFGEKIMNGNVNNQGQMTLDEMERQLNQPVQSQDQMCIVGNNGVRADIKFADPAQKGYLPLNDLFEPVVVQIKKQFNLSTDINEIWLHINHKLFADVPFENRCAICPYNVLEYLYVCIDNNLNPLKPEVASYYVYDYKTNTHSIKTQILLEGYNKIYSTHPQSNGLEYQIYPDVEREFIETEWVTDPQTKKKVKRNRVVKKLVPSRVECRIFRKDMEHPTVGFAFPDDIGNTGAWTGHPSQMMCNCAFTRAVRMAYNLEGTSAEDVFELKDQNISAHQSYNTEQELSYEKTTNGVINNISSCATLIDLNQQVGAYQKVMDKLPAEYRQRILIKIGEMNNLLRKKEHEQKKQVGNNQTAQQNNNNQQNMNQGYDFENQLIS